MHGIYQTIQTSTGLTIETQEKILLSLIIICVLLIARFFIIRGVNKWAEDVTRKYFWRRGVNYILTALALILIGRVWSKGMQSLSTFLGIAGAGLIIALQDSVINIAGWIFILSRNPFRVGDRIEIGGIRGDVIDIRLFQFSVVEIGGWVDADQSTGRIVHVPNGKVFKEPLINYTAGFDYIWNEIPVLITFESNWETAKKILEKVVAENTESFSESAEKEIKKAAEKYMIHYSKLTPVVYTSVRGSGILLTIRYLTKPRTRRGTEQAVWEAVLREFARHPDIDFAYPTTRFYDNLSEGKPGARPGNENLK